MDFSDDVHQEPDIEITLDQFKDFLFEAERSDKCPVCPHRGAWNFYIDKARGLGGQSLMALTPMISRYPESEEDTYYVLTMDCPQCGYMSYTNSKAVLEWLRSKEKGDE
ncbi:hypothetical protein [Pseudomonas urmiensis]|uniref:Uncharacterized protein n=1 Tax=Pseudomonas urmiensis TaxID=2745493 RepID=A0A923FY32_9PSED|nr:hypothetical protein [Pseudomonas urmiensis]MBV4536893.1 hypothetical protein [Pseudomonas urmiensis]